EVARTPLPPRKRLVGDMTDEVLQERVLAVLRRARVRLERDDLLPHEREQQRVELRLGEARERGKRAASERLSEHGPVLQQAALVRRKVVEAGRDERMQRLRHLERVDRSDGSVNRAVLDECSLVEEHANRFDRVEGNALRAGEDLLAERTGQAGDEAVQQRL